MRTAVIATLRYQGAEPFCVLAAAWWVRVGVIDQGDDDRHRRGDQRHPQVLDDGDDAVVATEFTGDRDQP